ncbi:hypothetical protein SY88_03390 [Clostridiales bacterium PH28_bin88]|nr:hypothetical protein SY88_03390 [Clostridiales bacterium PH28_bin88]
MPEVVIIGGGITGLAAAYTLQKAGNVDYLLVERDRRLGGKILTEKVDGFIIEGGPDCYLAEKPSVARLSAQMGIEHRLLCSNEDHKGTLVLSRGRLHKLPEGLMLMVPTKILPFALSPLISWPGKFRMALDLLLPVKKDDSDETLAQFVTRRLGREALDKIAGPLIGGIHGSDAEEMSLKASFPRFIKMEQDYGSLTRAMLAARKKAAAIKPDPGKPRHTYFMSFIEGMGELTDTAAARLDPRRVVTGVTVTGIERFAAGGNHRYRLHFDHLDPVEADVVIVTAPANQAAELVEDLDRALAGTLAEIPMASSATISLAYRRDEVSHPMDGFGFLIPHIEGRKISAVTYSSVKWDHRVPDCRHVLLRTFVGGAHNQELVDLSDQELLNLVRREFREIMGITAEPELSMIHRWVKCRPQYTLGHLDRVAAIEKRTAAYTGLYLAGASYRGIGIPDCINDGIKAAENAIAYLRK